MLLRSVLGQPEPCRILPRSAVLLTARCGHGLKICVQTCHSEPTHRAGQHSFQHVQAANEVVIERWHHRTRPTNLGLQAEADTNLGASCRGLIGA